MTPHRTDRPAWYSWIPGWVPICITILGAAFYVGRYTQSINDRLNALENAVAEIKQYLHEHPRASNELPPISDATAPPQDAAIPATISEH